TTLPAACSLIRARIGCSELQRRPIVRTLTNILVPSANGRCAVRPKTGSDAVDAILYAAQRIRTATDGVLREHGLALSGLKLLKALGEGDRSMREISQVLHVSPRTVTDMIDGLEGRGLVARCAHATDRRVTLLRLTEAGRAGGAPPPRQYRRRARGRRRHQRSGRRRAADPAEPARAGLRLT